MKVLGTCYRYLIPTRGWNLSSNPHAYITSFGISSFCRINHVHSPRTRAGYHGVSPQGLSNLVELLLLIINYGRVSTVVGTYLNIPKSFRVRYNKAGCDYPPKLCVLLWSFGDSFSFNFNIARNRFKCRYYVVLQTSKSACGKVENSFETNTQTYRRWKGKGAYKWYLNRFYKKPTNNLTFKIISYNFRVIIFFIYWLIF